MTVRMKRWMALGATVAMLLAAMAYGTDHTPCYEAYLMSGLNGQQMSFEEFREAYSDSVCSRGESAVVRASTISFER
jgi:hypothetical protein